MTFAKTGDNPIKTFRAKIFSRLDSFVLTDRLLNTDEMLQLNSIKNPTRQIEK